MRSIVRRTVAETRYGYDQKIARRSARTLFRVLLVVAVFALMFTYHDSQRPEHKRIIRREVIKKQISQRLGPRNSDPRAWPGWKGIKAIYALYVSTSWSTLLWLYLHRFPLVTNQS